MAHLLALKQSRFTYNMAAVLLYFKTKTCIQIEHSNTNTYLDLFSMIGENVSHKGKPTQLCNASGYALLPYGHKKNCPPSTRRCGMQENSKPIFQPSKGKRLPSPTAAREEAGSDSGVLAFFCEVASSQICPLCFYTSKSSAFFHGDTQGILFFLHNFAA